MLIRFEVSNFRSIKSPAELSMVAIDRDRDAAREAPMLDEGLLTVAGIYGPNASGKSNVVAAMAWLVEAVDSSLHWWDDEIPSEPFAFGTVSSTSTEFALELLVDGIRYEYVVELDADKVHYEALFHYPEKKRRRLFEREGTTLKLQRGLGKLSGTRELLTDRALALSIARRFDEPVVVDFANQLLDTCWPHQLTRHPGADRTGSTRVPGLTHKLFELGPDGQLDLFQTAESTYQKRDRALALLRVADFGIDDVSVSTEKTGNRTRTRQRHRIRLLHRAGGRSAPLDFAQESAGTRAWFDLIGPLLATFESGSLLVIDELDASLHPTLCARLIELFHDPDTNPNGAQLVFTSHDTSLLSHLNRDQVWLTEKTDAGATRLGALSDFAGERVRRSRNLEVGYLHGRFGGLPEVDQSDFLRALGLIG